MTAVVLDASVVLKWWATDEEGADQAYAYWAALDAGTTEVVAPRLLLLEILNTAGRRWGWSEGKLTVLGGALDAIAFRFEDPAAVDVARWVAAGPSAYDACYVALAERLRLRVVTTDTRMLSVAPHLTTALA